MLKVDCYKNLFNNIKFGEDENLERAKIQKANIKFTIEFWQ